MFRVVALAVFVFFVFLDVSEFFLVGLLVAVIDAIVLGVAVVVIVAVAIRITFASFFVGGAGPPGHAFVEILVASRTRPIKSFWLVVIVFDAVFVEAHFAKVAASDLSVEIITKFAPLIVCAAPHSFHSLVVVLKIIFGINLGDSRDLFFAFVNNGSGVLPPIAIMIEVRLMPVAMRAGFVTHSALKVSGVVIPFALVTSSFWARHWSASHLLLSSPVWVRLPFVQVNDIRCCGGEALGKARRLLFVCPP
jgi:hypothetical protein